jgi:hypothetical protein
MAEEKEIGGEHYTLWYEGWTPVEEKVLEPNLNIMIKEVKIKVTNPLIQLVGKLNLVNYTVCKEGFNYYIFAEIGYMEMGGVKVAFMPGEIVQDLICGGDSLTADGSFSGKDFGHKSVYELFGEDTICFGLMNDAIGYVVPDNDFTMGDPVNHYHELISLGKYVASALTDGLIELESEIVRVCRESGKIGAPVAISASIAANAIQSNLLRGALMSRPVRPPRRSS